MAGTKSAASARFKGTMLMATSPVAKAADNPVAANPAPAAVAQAPAATPAAAPAAAAAPAPLKAQAKSTIIGTGLGAGPVTAAGSTARAVAEKPASPAAVAMPNVAAAKPNATVLGAAPPTAAAIAAHAAPAAAAPIAAAAAAAGAAVQARVAEPAPAKPADDKRNMAFAATQHHGAFAAAQPPATAQAVPRTSPNLGAPVPADFDPHAETDPPEAPPGGHLADAPEDSGDDDSAATTRDPRYLPGDPMAPQPVAARAPMLRYDDSIPQISRRSGDDKKWLWIAAGVIVVACLGLVIVLASRMGH
jgi:hypothetical protein